MIDICMALDQSVSPHTGVRTIQNTGFSGRRYFNRLVPTPFFWNTAPPPNLLKSRTHTIPPATQASAYESRFQILPVKTLSQLEISIHWWNFLDISVIVKNEFTKQFSNSLFLRLYNFKHNIHTISLKIRRLIGDFAPKLTLLKFSRRKYRDLSLC